VGSAVSDRTLTSAPSLTPMYVKAAVTGALHRGNELPAAA
jgi:hypothetical protein